MKALKEAPRSQVIPIIPTSIRPPGRCESGHVSRQRDTNALRWKEQYAIVFTRVDGQLAGDPSDSLGRLYRLAIAKVYGEVRGYITAPET